MKITQREKAAVNMAKSEQLHKLVPSLAEHRARIRYLREPAAEYIRKMRNSERF